MDAGPLYVGQRALCDTLEEAARLEARERERIAPGLEARDVPELVEHGHHALPGLEHQAHAPQVLLVTLVGEGATEELGTHHHGGERVFEVVGDDADVLLAEALELLAARDVEHRGAGAHHAAILVLYRDGAGDDGDDLPVSAVDAVALAGDPLAAQRAPRGELLQGETGAVHPAHALDALVAVVELAAEQAPELLVLDDAAAIRLEEQDADGRVVEHGEQARVLALGRASRLLLELVQARALLEERAQARLGALDGARLLRSPHLDAGHRGGDAPDDEAADERPGGAEEGCLHAPVVPAEPAPDGKQRAEEDGREHHEEERGAPGDGADDGVVGQPARERRARPRQQRCRGHEQERQRRDDAHAGVGEQVGRSDEGGGAVEVAVEGEQRDRERAEQQRLREQLRAASHLERQEAAAEEREGRAGLRRGPPRDAGGRAGRLAEHQLIDAEIDVEGVLKQGERADGEPEGRGAVAEEAARGPCPLGEDQQERRGEEQDAERRVPGGLRQAGQDALERVDVEGPAGEHRARGYERARAERPRDALQPLRRMVRHAAS